MTAEHDPNGLDVALEVARAMRSQTPPPKNRKKKVSYTSRRNRESGDLQPVGEVLNKVIEDQGWGTDISLRVLLSRWAQLVGSTNAQHSRPDGFANGVLHVRAESTTWAAALRMMAPQLVAKLNEQLGQGTVTRVEVKGPTAPSWKHGKLTVRDGRGPRDTYG
jgi:predicted nucleic acid-binding Zn ribbon protein